MRSLNQPEVIINSGNAIEWAGDDSWASTLSDDDDEEDSPEDNLMNSASPYVESIPESENSAQLVQFGYRFVHKSMLLKIELQFRTKSMRSSRLSSGIHRTTSEVEVRYTLCIQMEFCTLSLRRYLVDRYNIHSLFGFKDDLETSTSREIIWQVYPTKRLAKRQKHM